MVRGSGYDPGDNETTSSSGYYDGSVAKWPTGSVKIKSSLHKYGLWNVVKNGPTTKPSPVEALPSVGKEMPPVPEPTSMWYLARQDNVVQGPFTSRQLMDAIMIIGRSETVTSDSVWIFHHTATSNVWQPWDPELEVRLNIQTQLAIHLRTPATRRPGANVETHSETESKPSSLVFSPDEARTSRRESGQQRECTKENDVTAFHHMLERIDDKSPTGESLLLTVSKKFEDNESGHALWKFLEARSTFGPDKDGIVDADESKRQVQEFTLCKGKPITIEALALGADDFERAYKKQPQERQGLRTDIFDAWAEKLPAKPFHESFLPTIKGLDLMNNGALLEDFSLANRHMRGLYAQYLKTNAPVQGLGRISDSSPHALLGEQAYVRKGKGKGGGKGNSSRKWWCFRCWKSDDHLSGQCDEAPGVCAACGMDSAKASLSCGGEKDPTKCMIKGYGPQGVA